MSICVKDIMKGVSSPTHVGYFLSIAEESCCFENFPVSICVKDVVKRVSSPTHVGHFYPLQKNHAILRIFL